MSMTHNFECTQYLSILDNIYVSIGTIEGYKNLQGYSTFGTPKIAFAFVFIPATPISTYILNKHQQKGNIDMSVYLSVYPEIGDLGLYKR